MTYKVMTTESAAKAAAEALKDLNMFAAIQALCEHSLISARGHEDEQAIVRISHRAQASALRRYDAAMAHLATKPK